MAGANVQAKLPQFRSIGDQIRSINMAARNNIDPPRIVVLTGGSDVVFDARAGTLLADRKVVSKLVIHNLGANAMYLGINTLANTLAGSFHDILAGGTVVKDGLGSSIDLSHDQPDFVTIKGTAGEWVAVLIGYPPDNMAAE